jgi:argininosuccinate lyase
MFDTVRTLQGALLLFAPMIATMKVKRDVIRHKVDHDFSNATDIADYLAAKGMPFRKAHEVIGKIVYYCIEQKKFLLDLTLEEYQGFSKLFDDNIFQVLQPESVVNARNVYGGTARPQVEQAIERADSALQATREWVEQTAKKIQI